MVNMLEAALDGVGIAYPGREVTEGRFTRWGRNSRYWAKAVGEGYVFGDYAAGVSESIFPKSESNKKDCKKHKREIAAAREKEEVKKRAGEEAAAVAALQRWNNSTPISGNGHPYLKAKGVDSFGLKIHGNYLVVPLYDLDGSLSSIQYIYYDHGTSDYQKRFHPGCRTQGCFYPIGDETERILLCEGYATAASVYMATGEQTVVCFSARNIPAVASLLQGKYPAKELIVCADNDKNEASLKAAKATGLKYIYPKFNEDGVERFRKLEGKPDGYPTDFNDYMNIYGLEELKECLRVI
jgi:putative DNA primase/helicase